ncbi:hypothetical protein ABVT39_019814 [Epinephelus coioides]
MQICDFLTLLPPINQTERRRRRRRRRWQRRYRAFCGINPPTDSKAEKKRGLNAPVCTLLRKLLDFELMGNSLETTFLLFGTTSRSVHTLVLAFCGINPPTDSKAEKKRGLNAPVCTLLRKLLDFELMGK